MTPVIREIMVGLYPEGQVLVVWTNEGRATKLADYAKEFKWAGPLEPPV